MKWLKQWRMHRGITAALKAQGRVNEAVYNRLNLHDDVMDRLDAELDDLDGLVLDSHDRIDTVSAAVQRGIERYLDLESRVADLEAAPEKDEWGAGYAWTERLAIEADERWLEPFTRLEQAKSARGAAEAAIARKQTLRFYYRKLGEEQGEWRVISPYEVYPCEEGHELVRGWDHVRRAIRSFRLDRAAHWSASHFVYRNPEEV